MLPSRMIRDIGQRQIDEADLLAFIDLLVEALEIPEVAQAVAERLPNHQQPSPPPVAPRPSPPGRGKGTRRG